MDKKEDWLRKLWGQFPAEGTPGLPIVELAGDCRVLIEQHKGVTEYGGKQICVRVQFGAVQICGRGLELKKLARGQLVITGRIDSLQLIRRG